MMFERFTEKAIKVVMLAQEEARRLGHNFVGTEQILLGLIGESTGIAAKVCSSPQQFDNPATSLDALWRGATQRFRQQPLQIVFGRQILNTCFRSQVLKSMGVNLKDARVETEKIIGRGSGFVAVEIPFTPRAKRVLELSLEEARQLGYFLLQHCPAQ